MIIISASMPRSASLWHMRLTQDILKTNGIEYPGQVDARKKLKLNFPENIHRLEWWKILQLVKYSDAHTFTVKTHHAPTYLLNRLIQDNKLKATYIYRDPRDVIISAMELGKKIRDSGDAKRYFYVGPFKSFARLHTLQGAINWVKFQLYPRHKKWINCDNSLATKYEDLVCDTFNQVKLLSEYIGIDLKDEEIIRITEKYQTDDKGKVQGDFWREGRGYMKNKGKIRRFEDVLSQKEIDTCNYELKNCLASMGYN